MSKQNAYYEDFDLIAAEFTLGLLSPEERAGAEEEYLSNATFRSLVEDWDTLFFPFSQSYGEAESPDIWPILKDELFPHRSTRLRDIIEHAAFVPVMVGAKLSLIFMLVTLIMRR